MALMTTDYLILKHLFYTIVDVFINAT